MLIAQMSDMHLMPKGDLTFGKVDTFGHLERCVAHLNALEPRPDAVLVTGDLTNDGRPEEYEALVPLLGRLEMPFYPIIGNHDSRPECRRAFAALGLLPDEGRLCYLVDEHPVRLIALDTQVPGKPWGELGPEQIGWLAARLAEAGDRPTVIFLHHPPFCTGIAFMDAQDLRDRDALAAVVARHPQVERVLCGHIHRPIQVRFAGTLAMTAPGTAHQVALGLAPGAKGGWLPEPPAVLLHRWIEGQGFVSHTSYVGDFGQPSPFTDAHVRAG